MGVGLLLVSIVAAVAAWGMRGAAVAGPPAREESLPSAARADAPRAFLAAGAPDEAPPVSLVLNEVVFAPAAGEAAWVELRNASSEPVRPGGFSLLDAFGIAWRLPDSLPELAPGGLLLVRFDPGEAVAEPSAPVLHAPAADFLHPERGAVSLAAPNGARLDRVAWGEDQPGAVAPGPGGRAAALEPGTSFGRVPVDEGSAGEASAGQAPAGKRSADEASAGAWVAYPPTHATPGEANGLPEPGVLLPLDGAALHSGEAVQLRWHPVPGAAAYAVQVGGESGFDPPVLEREVAAPELIVGSLPEGRYRWRVRPLFPGGGAGAFSPTRSLGIAASGPSSRTGFTTPPSAGPAPAGPSAAAAAPGARARSLDVPLIEQRKDTRMLLLESDRPDGAHAWNAPHARGDRGDPADNGNCGLAVAAMVNAWFHQATATGERGVSQDRIGYEVHRDRLPGPERDLHWGSPLMDPRITRALAFAVGGEAHQRMVKPWRDRPAVPDFPDSLWNDLRREIDAGRPVVIGVPGHVVVGTGYREDEDGERWVSVNDPGLSALRYAVQVELLESDSYWLLSPGRPPADEAGIHEDSDGDGMVDFDEAERFGTDPGRADGDGDGRSDLADVFESVFDPEHGWAHHYRSSGGWSPRVRLAMELEADTDGGGCPDGQEDANGNGRRDEGETWNFDEIGDGCPSMCVPGPAARERYAFAQLRGTITQEYTDKTVRPDRVHQEISESYTLTAEVAARARMVDDGSSVMLSFGGPAWARVSWSGEGVYFDEPWSTDVTCPARVTGGASWYRPGLDAPADTGEYQVFVDPADCPADELDNRPDLGGWYGLEAAVGPAPLCGLDMSGAVEHYQSGGEPAPAVLRDELRWSLALVPTQPPEFDRTCRGAWLEAEPSVALGELSSALFAIAAPATADAGVMRGLEALVDVHRNASEDILEIIEAREALLRTCTQLGEAWLDERGDTDAFQALLRELKASDARLTAGWEALDATVIPAVRTVHEAAADLERRQPDASPFLAFRLQRLLGALESGGLLYYQRDPDLEAL